MERHREIGQPSTGHLGRSVQGGMLANPHAVSPKHECELLYCSEVIDSVLSGKSSTGVHWVPVPQTDAGRRVEYTKTIE